MSYPGILLVFCGLDGSGKTTQAKLLAQRLEEAMFQICLTSQPTLWYLKDPFVQKYFEEGTTDEYGIASLALFSAADRARHLSEVILPNLNAGKVVISSRYVFSAYTYFFARGLRDQVWLEAINRYAIEPDLTFFLDLEPEVALRRVAKRGDRVKREELDFARLQEVRQRFVSFASDNYRILDANQDQKKLHQRIVSIVMPMVQGLGRKHTPQEV